MADLDIISAPSPNFNERRGAGQSGPDMLVLHYTGMESGEAALERMRDPAAEVSAHYMVEEDGRIFQLVEESKRAWHAGVADWAGQSDLNSHSIGVEIVNGGHDFGLPPFPSKQVQAVIKLCQSILSRHAIPVFNILGHSDIAPHRKEDPGELFPWRELAQKGIGYWPPSVTEHPDHQDFAAGEVRRALKAIGYGFDFGASGEQALTFVTRAFQRRWRPSRVDGVLDSETRGLIKLTVSDYVRMRSEHGNRA